jgi:hypothetical protein
MKRVAASFAVAALITTGVVVAQTSPSPTPPSDRSTYPSTAAPPSSTSSGSSSGMNSTTAKSHKQQMKDCMTAQQANNPNESKTDIKKYCKGQVENAPHE